MNSLLMDKLWRRFNWLWTL